MLLQKTIHVRQCLDETKARLTQVRAYRHTLPGFQLAAISANGTGHFEFSAGLVFRLRVQLVTLPTDDASQILFRSTGGDADVSGLIEFLEIREDLTEVQITLDYALHSRVRGFLDNLTGSMDRFLNRQLSALTAHLAGERSSIPTRPIRRPMAFAPGVAQLAH